MNNEYEELGFQIELSDDDVRTLHYAVQSALENWPGSPSRPAEEQAKLWDLRDSLFRMILEIQFGTEA